MMNLQEAKKIADLFIASTPEHQAAVEAIGPNAVKVWTIPGTVYHDGSRDYRYGFTINGISWDEAGDDERIIIDVYHDGEVR